ncbi:MAG: heme biosynthesis protein HemY [Gammaproteobacteria bacterium]|nr:heme biosynthesis protein HemY [Gammaproteobacteria bacterium]
MRLLLVALLVLAAAVGFTLLAQHDPGYLLLSYGGWSVESSLSLFLLAIAIGFVLFYLVLRLLFGTLHLPGRLAYWRRQRRALRARRATNRGLLALAEGNWPRAERFLSRYAASSDTPLLNYLGAARAAQKQGADARRDDYLSQAYQSMPDAELAVGLTQAEVQLSADQAEQALATLRHLRTIAPKHAYVLHLLRKIYERLESWDDLLELIPELTRQNLLSQEEAAALSHRVHSKRLQLAGERPDALHRCWDEIPKALRETATLRHDYVLRLIKLGAHGEAEKQLRDYLKNRWDPTLIRLYGQVQGEEPARQLTLAERWLTEYGQHPEQLLALARLCFANKLWGKGRSYLEASIGFEPRAESYCELGQLLEQTGEPGRAAECFRKGLQLAAGEACTPVIIPADGDRLHHHG